MKNNVENSKSPRLVGIFKVATSDIAIDWLGSMSVRDCSWKPCKVTWTWSKFVNWVNF